MTQFVVVYPNGWFLRGTTATGEEDRATRFDTEEQAHTALNLNKKFLNAQAFKAARIQPIG